MREVEKTINIAKTIVHDLPICEDTKGCIILGIHSAEIVYKLELEREKNHICEQAQLHNLDLVTAITLTIDGRQQTALRVYGGDISGFCRSLGLTLVSDEKLFANLSYIERMVRQNGVVIYERK